MNSWRLLTARRRSKGFAPTPTSARKFTGQNLTPRPFRNGQSRRRSRYHHHRSPVPNALRRAVRRNGKHLRRRGSAGNVTPQLKFQAKKKPKKAISKQFMNRHVCSCKIWQTQHGKGSFPTLERNISH